MLKLFMTQRSNWMFFYNIFVLQGFSVIDTFDGPDVDLGLTQVDICYANSSANMLITLMCLILVCEVKCLRSGL